MEKKNKEFDKTEYFDSDDITQEEFEIIFYLLEIAVNDFRVIDDKHKTYSSWDDELKLTEKEFITFIKLLKKLFTKECYESFKEILAPFIDDNWDV